MAALRRIGFVLPRFGKEIGGAETLCAEIAKQLNQRGDTVEILTTCAKDNRSWSNHYPAGIEIVSGLKTRRFLVDERDLDSWVPKQIAISEGLKLSVDDQLDWMAESVNSTELYSFIASEGKRFDHLIFAPYLFGTTFWGALISPENSIVLPCLHDESYAYLEIMQYLFSKVKGCIFNAEPEMELARKLYGEIRGGEVGVGFVSPTVTELANITPYFTNSDPYILYLGRKETGKNAHLLIDYFVQAKEQFPELAPLKLVFLGGGDFTDLGREGERQRLDIIDLPFLSEDEKRRVVKHALALVNPSVNESFSIVLMEAWLLGVPVVVNAQCAVTRKHVEDSGGGLYFANLDDFSGCLIELLRESALRVQLALAGRRYVEERYSWKAVLKRFDEVVDEITSGPKELEDLAS